MRSRHFTTAAGFIALAMMIIGCAGPRSQSGTATAARPLASPLAIDKAQSATQIVRGAFGSREMTMNSVLSVRDGIVTVIGLTSMGVRAFTLRYDGQQLHVDNNLPVPAQLTPERLVADIQLVYWPLKSLQQVLSPAGYTLTEPTSGTRRLRAGDRLIAEVHYQGEPWQSRSWLVNLEHGYTLQIDSTPANAAGFQR